jgi:hypothetical protein
MIHSYDSNALYATSGPKGDYVLQVIPGGDYVWNSQRFHFTLGYRLTYRNNLDESVQDGIAQAATFEGRYRLSRRISIGATERFERTSDPADIQIPDRLDRWTNEATGEVRYTTPGEDFDTTIRYTNAYQKYEGELAALSFFNNKVSMTSRVNISSRFRFLPKSVASATVEYGQTNFRDDPLAVTENNDSKGVGGKIGLTSQVTRKISLSADVGASSLFFDAGPDALGVTGGVSTSFRPNLKMSFLLGYQRAVQIATFTNYYNDHRFLFDSFWKFARKMQYNLKAAFDFVDFSGPNTIAPGEDRNDFVVQVLSGISYSVTEWCKARVEYQLDYRDSNAVNPMVGNAGAGFTKHRGNLGIDFYY